MAKQLCTFNICVQTYFLCAYFTPILCTDLINNFEELKKLDDSIFQCIHYPSSLHGWDALLRNMDLYTRSLQHIMNELNKSGQEYINKEAEKIWNIGVPKFITQDLDETMYSVVIEISEEQRKRYYEMQDIAEQIWNKFGEIVKMKQNND